MILFILGFISFPVVLMIIATIATTIKYRRGDRNEKL